MNVSLTPQLEGLIDRKVKSGRYGSASEVVREALRLLEERDAMQAAKLKQLQQDVRTGVSEIESGKGTRVRSSELGKLASDVKAAGRRRSSRR
jgi:antitoxin ParD1/3/4